MLQPPCLSFVLECSPLCGSWSTGDIKAKTWRNTFFTKPFCLSGKLWGLFGMDSRKLSISGIVTKSPLCPRFQTWTLELEQWTTQASSSECIANRLQTGKATDVCLWQDGFYFVRKQRYYYTGLTEEKKIKFKISKNLVFLLELINTLDLMFTHKMSSIPLIHVILPFMKNE